jgi:hypothetical protein
MWNKFLTWLDGCDRKTGTYIRAVSPADNWKFVLVILLPILVITTTVILVFMR